MLAGDFRIWSTQADSGSITSFRFCPDCGGTVAYSNETMPGTIAVPIGGFADPDFPAPQFSVYEERKHRWVAIVGEGVERD